MFKPGLQFKIFRYIELLAKMFRVTRNDILKAMQKMKSGGATGLSEVSLEITVASGEIGIEVMMNMC